jgi:hypothetical protein
MEVALPVELLLAADSVAVLHPTGLAKNGKKRPYVGSPDTVASQDAVLPGVDLWRVGSNGTLSPHGVTPPRILSVTIPNGVLRTRLAFVAVAQVADTSTPPLPPEQFAHQGDTLAFPVVHDGPDLTLYRTVMGILFNESASGPAVRGVLQRAGATIVAGTSIGSYIVTVPDPGAGMAALDAALDRLNDEAVVDVAYPVAYRQAIVLDTRLPTDAVGLQPLDWQTGTPAVLPYQAVRLPEAWGCETGMYGGQPVPVAVIDRTFDHGNPDLAQSSPKLVTPPHDRMGAGVDPGPGHGTAVASVLSAQGDNRSGVAGVMWQTDLRLFALGSAQGDSVVADWPRYIAEELMPALEQDGVPIVVMSFDALTAHFYQIGLLERAFQRYVDSGGLLVLAAGNQKDNTTLFDLANSAGHRLITPAAARLIQKDHEAAVMLVGGASVDGGTVTRWVTADGHGSDYVAGGMEIAAPAKGVTILQDSNVSGSGTGVGTMTTGGTSVAAPMVAGVAAQLKAMVPALSGREIKDLIRRGSFASRYRKESGQIQPPPQVAGMAGVYLLDAYGALSLLSNERKGAPLCGVRVQVSGDGIFLDRRDVPGGEFLSLPGSGSLDAPSVAQGGRRIAVFDGDAGVARVFTQQGALLHTVAGVQVRQFLERDTADIRWVIDATGGRQPSVRISGPGGTRGPFQPAGQVVDWIQYGGGTFRVSMDGKAAAFDLFAGDFSNPESATLLYGAYVVELDGNAAPTTIEETRCTLSPAGDDCADRLLVSFPLGIAWAPDSYSLTLAFPELDGPSQNARETRTRYRRVTRFGDREAVSTVYGREAMAPSPSADGLLFASLEYEEATESCHLTWRAVDPLARLVRDVVVSDPQTCHQGVIPQTLAATEQPDELRPALSVPTAGQSTPASLRQRWHQWMAQRRERR